MKFGFRCVPPGNVVHDESYEVRRATDGTSPERVGLTVLDQVQTEDQGLTGVLLEVTDASATPAMGDQEVTLSVSYETSTIRCRPRPM